MRWTWRTTILFYRAPKNWLTTELLIRVADVRKGRVAS